MSKNVFLIGWFVTIVVGTLGGLVLTWAVKKFCREWDKRSDDCLPRSGHGNS